jgi:WD40 repeat protein
VSVYRNHSREVYALTWSPDSQIVATASLDETVQLWSAADAQPRLTYNGHHGGVYAVMWEPSGQRIASGGADQTVQLWDPASGKLLFTYHGHADSTPVSGQPRGLVHALAWSPNMQFIASASLDGAVQVWRVPS